MTKILIAYILELNRGDKYKNKNRKQSLNYGAHLILPSIGLSVFVAGNDGIGLLLALPFDGANYLEYLALVVRGLVWWGWNCVVPADYLVQVVSMTARKFTQFEENILSIGPRERKTGTYANGGLTYSASFAPDDRAFSVWRVDLYGSLLLATDDIAGNKHQLVAAAMTGPPTLSETFERMVEWGSTT